VSDADYAAAVGPPRRGEPPPAGHVAPVALYFGVYAALLVLTALTVFVAFFHLGPLNNVVALGIAATKATLVALYFMHVRWSSRLVTLCVVTGLFFVVHLMGGTLQDYFTRGLLGVPGK
jgi:cytochrome c oxidase subunit 4